jgi:octaprenyl-diphosphate synthase
MNLNEIKAPVENHVIEFEKRFRDSMKSKVPLLDKITRYIVKRKGKQIRPLFVFFSAGLCGEISEKTYRAASLIELLHTATLIHDDVVDDSNERRGFFSLNALWKNKISVLVGDYLLSRGLLLALDNDDFELLKIVSRSVKQMSEGELLQMEKARNLDISEDFYFEIITKKTASLIASCFECGSASGGADKYLQEKMRQIGEYTGIAFQIKDDLLDFDNGKNTGKPTGGDIKERKMTLPLIHILGKSSYFEKRKLINIVKNHNQDPEKVAILMDMVSRGGGIDYARGKMEQYLQKAYDVLETFPDSTWRRSLKDLIRFTIEREK